MKNMRIIIVGTALMLFLALADFPYAYYQILRWVVCGVAAYSAYNAHEHRSIVWTWIFGVVAILFNPIAPIHFQRETWMTLDVAAAVIFLISLFRHTPHTNQ
ncbi:hypothetical protein AUJ46_02310 [Candidatus Peregrinibacteria bacterium CG1_02_54_53]|nr:MAG: hypothetical protein AUJ46_02310 [Candidatus Peregrinibacteria bacterium CG1_02_54_53]